MKQVIVRLDEDRDADLWAWYKAIDRGIHGEVNRQLLAALKRGMNAVEATPETQSTVDADVIAAINALPAVIREMLEAVLANVSIVAAQADQLESSASDLLEELTLD